MRLFIDDVNRELTANDYTNNSEYIVKNLKEFSWVKMIGLFGATKFPGISDLDYIFVVKVDNYKEYKEIIYKVLYESPKANSLIIHEQIVVTEKDYYYIKLFHSIENLKILFNKNFINNAINDFAFCRMLIWNSFFYPEFFNMYSSKEIGLRKSLLLINNLAYSIKNMGIKEANAYKLYKNKVDKVRNDVLQNKEYKETLSMLIEEGIEILKKYEINEIILKRKVFHINRSVLYKNGSLKFYFFKKIRIYTFPDIYFIFLKILKNKNIKCNIKKIKQMKKYKLILKKYLNESNQTYPYVLDKFCSVTLLNYYRIK